MVASSGRNSPPARLVVIVIIAIIAIVVVFAALASTALCVFAILRTRRPGRWGGGWSHANIWQGRLITAMRGLAGDSKLLLALHLRELKTYGHDTLALHLGIGKGLHLLHLLLGYHADIQELLILLLLGGNLLLVLLENFNLLL